MQEHHEDPAPAAPESMRSYSVLFADNPGAVLEKSILGEWAASVIRLSLVIFAAAMFFAFSIHHAPYPRLAVAIILLAGAYSVYLLWREPYRHHDFLISSTFVSITDASLVLAFLYATGSFQSPYYPLLYASVVGFSFRYGPWETLAGALIHAGGYAALLQTTGALLPNFGDASIRIGFIFLLAALGSLLSIVAARQTVAKDTYQHLAQDLEEAREQLQKRTLELERSNQDLQRFADAISHDAREPLRVISGHLGLIERRTEGTLDEDVQDFLQHAKDAAQRLDGMIQGLLKYSRVDRNASFETFPLEEALQGAKDNLNERIQETNTKIEHEALPRIHGDKNQLMMLFQNLIANAITYTKMGAPCVTITSTKTADGHRIEVQDDGIGIPIAEQERIFTMFQRGTNAPQTPGDGIGLSLCKRIIERHEGTIGVESTPGQGSTFHFTLPDPDA